MGRVFMKTALKKLSKMKLNRAKSAKKGTKNQGKISPVFFLKKNKSEKKVLSKIGLKMSQNRYQNHRFFLAPKYCPKREAKSGPKKRAVGLLL